MSLFERFSSQSIPLELQAYFDPSLLDFPEMYEGRTPFELEKNFSFVQSDSTRIPPNPLLVDLVNDYTRSLLTGEFQILDWFFLHLFNFEPADIKIIPLNRMQMICDQNRLLTFMRQILDVFKRNPEWYKMQIAHCMTTVKYLESDTKRKEEMKNLDQTNYLLCPDAEGFLLRASQVDVLRIYDGHLLVKGLNKDDNQGICAGLCLRSTTYQGGLHFQAGVWYRPRDYKQACILLQQSRVSEVDWIAVRPLYPFWLTKRDDQTQLLARLAKLIK